MDTIDEDKRLERLSKVSPEVAKNFESYLEVFIAKAGYGDYPFVPWSEKPVLKNKWPQYLLGVYLDVPKVDAFGPDRYFDSSLVRRYFSLVPGEINKFNPAASSIGFKEHDEQFNLSSIELRSENMHFSKSEVQMLVIYYKEVEVDETRFAIKQNNFNLDIRYNKEGMVSDIMVYGDTFPEAKDDWFNFLLYGKDEVKGLDKKSKVFTERHKYSCSMSREGNKVEVRLFKEKEPYAVIGVPAKINLPQIIDKLVMPGTLENPITASPALDRSWKRDLKPAFGVSWVTLK